MSDFLSIPKEVSYALNRLCCIINDWADKKGWNEGPDSIEHKAAQIALMHSELSECLEAIRHKGLCPACACESTDGEHPKTGPQQWKCESTGQYFNEWMPMHDDKVPQLSGEAAELADVLIRIFHYCGKRQIDLGRAVLLKHEFNITRPYRHGKHI